MFGLDILFSLIQNMALVIVFILIGNRLYPSLIHWNSSLKKMVIGLMFSVSGILSMLVPIHVGDGSIVSMKNIVVALSAWIGGPLSALVTLIGIIAYRIYLGGIGMPAGIAASVTAAIIGLLFQHFRHADRRHVFQIINPLAIGILVTFNSIAWSFLLPDTNRQYFIQQYSLILFIIYPLSSILFHYFMNLEWSRQRELVIDDVTGLPHANLFRTKLKKKMKLGTPFYLTLLNIDGIKTINTLNTIQVRNELLRQIGQRLTHWLPNAASACRWEGDEFLICVPDPSFKKLPNIGQEYWQEMQMLLSAPYLIEHELCHVTVSTGMTAYTGEKILIDQILTRAYTALQHARDNGINKAVQYHEKLAEEIRHRTLIEVYLRTAIQEGQLSLYYQPQYDLHTGKLRGFEALLRWNHPELGAIPPSEFIPIAEETRLIIPIGEWVLKHACLTMQRLTTAPSPLTLSVNVSVVQLLEETFPEIVKETLRESGFAAEQLELELTESMLMSSLDIAERQLKRLQDIGVRLALDDFGIGYSSMNYLRRLPFQVVKIDRSFIQDIGQLSDQDVTGSMIQFIKQLRYVIVAEGLETYEQLAYLKKFDCDYAQGYLFSKPVPDDRLPAIIQGTRTYQPILSRKDVM